MSLCKKLLTLNCPRVFSPICALVFFVEWVNHSLLLQSHPDQWKTPHEPSQTSPLFLLALPLPWRLWRVLATWRDLSETRNASLFSHRHTYTDTSSINRIKKKHIALLLPPFTRCLIFIFTVQHLLSWVSVKSQVTDSFISPVYGRYNSFKTSLHSNSEVWREIGGPWSRHT